ncbi:MAG: DMT family transporter [Pseudomonadota bacterium]
MPHPAAAIALMVVSMALIPLGDTFGKLAIERHGVPPLTVAWTRFLIGLAAALPFLVVSRMHLRVLRDPRLYLRGLLIVAAIGCILTALQTEDIGSVFGAFFIGPVVAYVLTAWLLREPVRPARSLLLVLGFIGVLLVVKPGWGMTAGLGFALLAGLFYGCFLTASRWLAHLGAPGLQLTAQLLCGSLLLWPLGAGGLGPEVPWGLLLGSGLASFGGNMLLLFAYRLMPGTVLAPLVYLQLIAAMGFGLLVWGSLPDALALIGLALLLASGFGSLALGRRA